MTEGNRIFILRTSMKMTMEEFGSRIGITRGAVSNIEKREGRLTDQILRSVCREFNVSEEWLKTGEGEMLKPTSRSEAIARFAGELMKEEDSSFKKQFIEVLAELDESEWETLKNIALKFAYKGADEPSGNSEQFPKTPEELEEKYPPVEEEGKKKRSS